MPIKFMAGSILAPSSAFFLRGAFGYHAGWSASRFISSGVEHLPLSAAKPWFKSLIVCQPIDGHHGATVRCSTAVSGRRTNFPQPVRMAKADPFVRSEHPIPDPNDFPTCQVVSVRAPAATDGRPAPSACCLAGSKAVTVPKAYQAHTQSSHLCRRPPPIGSV